MLNAEKKITIEWCKNDETNDCITNPIQTTQYSQTDKLAMMIIKVLDEELPMIKNNSLLYDLVLYSLIEKMKTVQNVKNVISCIREHDAKTVNDVSFKNGEVYIKCSI